MSPRSGIKSALPANRGGAVSDDELLQLWAAGLSKTEIGVHVGFTKERVRQRLERNGIFGQNPNRLPPEAKVREQAATATSRGALAEMLGISTFQLALAVRTKAFKAELGRIFKRNRGAAVRARQEQERARNLLLIRTLAIAVKHTPTERDLKTVGLFPARLAGLFGSVPHAMELCGLVPNHPGRAPIPLPADFGNELAATDDPDLLRARAREVARAGQTKKPPGNPSPQKVQRTSTSYRRDPAVVAWVLREASGHCEACGVPGYETDDGTRFLEVHHVLPLEDDGPDVVENAIGVCAICHGKLHRWKSREKLRRRLLKEIERLVDFAASAPNS
jgi:5-methylcytosine-specific restriction endonuclease McrA